MEGFIETVRTGDAVEIDSVGIGDRARRAFAEANPANLGLDGLRRRITGTKTADAA